MELIKVKEPTSTINAHGKNRRCDFCNAEENTERLVGRYIVQLRRVEVYGVSKLACQTCIRKNEEILGSIQFKNEQLIADRNQQPSTLSHHFKLMISKILHVFTFALLLSTIVVAQPKFPDQPDQTPIDGGLGILAAAGGAYALKKLRDKSKEEKDL